MTVTTGVGLISGIDYESYISQISAISQRSVTLVQQQMSVKQGQASAFSNISSLLTTLRDQLKNMLEPENFAFTSANSSDTSVLDIQAENSAATGSYNVRVMQLAQAQRIGSQGVDSLSTPIASADGTLKIQVGTGAARSYSVTSATTLTELRDMINQDSQSGVTASIVNDGSATNPYRLILSAKSTGAANNVTILQNDTTLDFANKRIEDAVANYANQFDGATSVSGAYTGSGSKRFVIRMTQAGAVDGAARFEVSTDGGITFSGDYAATSTAQDISGGQGVQFAFAAGTKDFATGDTFTIDTFDPTIARAQDALISVDGIQISRATNTFSDVIDGVTFTAKSVSSSAITASVNFEKGLLSAEVIKFVDAYNNARSTLDTASAYDPNTETAAILFGDTTVRTLKSMLAAIVSKTVSGIDGEYNTLASIGLGTDGAGRMNFDQTKLNAALENPENIMKVFGRIGDSTSTLVRLADVSDSTPSGAYKVNVTQAAERAMIDGAQTIRSTGLASDENLTFTINDETFTVNLAAGDTLEAVMSKLNTAFSSKNAGLEAINNNGILRIQTTAYGSAAEFSVVSDADGSTNAQTGIGATLREDAGIDVQGTINGSSATGSGQTLSLANGLQLTITASAPVEATVTYTRGIADTLIDQLEKYIDSDSGIIDARQDGINDSISRMNERITTLQDRITKEADRLRKQFLNMEQQMAQWQSIGNALTASLQQLQNYQSK